MKKAKKTYPVTTEEDKYKAQSGRDAFEKEQESEYLDGQGLEEDLTDNREEIDNHGIIVDSDHPENQEWHAREFQNKSSKNKENHL